MSLTPPSTSPCAAASGAAPGEACVPPGTAPEVLAFIPARGGSKSIPRKNLALLGGRPLIAYSIEAALRSKMATRVVVSTDDEDIAACARSLGAEVPFLRPPMLAGDRSLIGEAVQHMLKRLARREGYKPDLLMELYPTSPFRRPELLDSLARIALQGYPQVYTVARLQFDPLRYFAPAAGGGLTPLLAGPNAEGWTYPVMRRYGLCSIFNLKPTPRTEPYLHAIDDPVELLDVDYPEDLAVAQAVMAAGLFGGGR